MHGCVHGNLRPVQQTETVPACMSCRLRGEEYYAVVDEFVTAVMSRWPGAVLQFEVRPGLSLNVPA